MKTFFRKKEELQGKKKYFLFDASGKTLGRFASEIAKILRGKHRIDYTPHQDSGDAVIVINAEKIKVTGSKEARKEYHHYTGWVGGLKTIPYRMMKQKKPEYIIKHAVKGMVPRNRLGRKQLRSLFVFRGGEHNLQAQKPIAVNI